MTDESKRKRKPVHPGIEHPLELDLWPEYDSVLGMDEAGRGPICGPLTVAGVIFPKGYQNPELNDSKKLTEKKREALVSRIRDDALFWQVLVVDEQTIDEKNIYRATQQAMEQIAESAGASFILSDAMPLPDLEDGTWSAIVKGDSKSLSIAAASILAKVCRDHYMDELDRLYPVYNLKKNKGYPTRQHLQAIDAYGVQPFYRKSYSPVASILAREEQVSLF